jgi:hypothetical protein
VGQSRAVVIAFVVKKNLGFLLQPPKRGRMNNAVSITLEIGTRRARFFIEESSAAHGRIRGIGRPRPAAKADSLANHHPSMRHNALTLFK